MFVSRKSHLLNLALFIGLKSLLLLVVLELRFLSPPPKTFPTRALRGCVKTRRIWSPYLLKV